VLLMTAQSQDSSCLSKSLLELTYTISTNTTIVFLVKLIGNKTTSNSCCRQGWPSLYSFEGKMTQPTRHRATCQVQIQKWTFLGKIGNKNDQSKNDTANKVRHTNCAFKNGFFLAKLGAKMTSLFALYTM
jgi:hypothetical protein